MENFKVGDVVRLKSGGPKMTVICADESLDKKHFWCHCSWFDNDIKSQTTIFPDVALSVVGPRKVENSPPVVVSTRRTDWEKTMQAILEEAEIINEMKVRGGDFGLAKHDQNCCESK